MRNPISTLKLNHRQRAFELLVMHQTISRVTIAKELGVSLQTAMKIMQYFTDFGLAAYVGDGDGAQVGRKPQMYRFNPNAAHIIGVLHEGSVITVGIMDLNCRIIMEQDAEIHGDIHDMLVTQPCKLTESMINRLKEKGPHAERLLGLGLCLPGVIDDVRNEISFALNFPTNASYQIGNLLTEASVRLGIPFLIENDVNAAAYGEHTNISAADMAYIAIGSGVGMGLVLDGNLRRGPAFTAGEIGLMPYVGATAPEQMRNVEDLIGLDGLKKRFGFDRRFGIDKMDPAIREGMINAISDVVAYIIAASASMLNISAFVLGGLTAQLLGAELFNAVGAKARCLSPFSITVRQPSCAHPALIGAARKVMDQQLEVLLSLDRAPETAAAGAAEADTDDKEAAADDK